MAPHRPRRRSTLTLLYSVFTLIWLPKSFVNLGNYDPIGNVFEVFALVAAGLVLFATFSPAGSSVARRRACFVLLFGVCPISFGVVHIVDMPGLLNPIPGWLPPSKMFWASHHHRLLRRLLSPSSPESWRRLPASPHRGNHMIFEVLFWMPRLFGEPRKHFNWAGNAISLSLAGAAWGRCGLHLPGSQTGGSAHTGSAQVSTPV